MLLYIVTDDVFSLAMPINHARLCYKLYIMYSSV